MLSINMAAFFVFLWVYMGMFVGPRYNINGSQILENLVQYLKFMLE